jgi:hypothetical protein
LRQSGKIAANNLRLRFRGPVHEELLRDLSRQTGTTDLIETLPPIPYRQALWEMMRADALLVMQGDNCNQQIPAKLYEYLRARRPILGLADPVGDTAGAMKAAGVRHIAKLEDADAVERTFAAFLEELVAGRANPADEKAVMGASRASRVREFVEMLDTVVVSA